MDPSTDSRINYINITEEKKISKTDSKNDQEKQKKSSKRLYSGR